MSSTGLKGDAPSSNHDFPVKNTFIHFDIKDSNGTNGEKLETDGAESVDSDGRLLYWLPSLSSSSSSRQRPASVDAARSSSSSEDSSRRDLQQMVAGWKKDHKRKSAKSTGASSSTAPPPPAAPPPPLAPAEAPPASPAPLLGQVDWTQGLTEVFRGIWQGSGAAEAAQAAAQPTSPVVDAEVVEVLMSIPRDESGLLTSIGSVGHDEGDCSPCPFWFKGVCLNGLACRHCHFMHEGQRPRRLRPSKQGRQRLKKRMEETGMAACSPSALALKLAEAAEQEGLQVASAALQRQNVAQATAAPPGLRQKIQMSL